jgi:hypothetical protein
VLVRYPVGDANKLLRQQEQKDAKKLDEDAMIDKELGKSQSKVVSVVVPETKAAVAVESKAVPISELKLLEVDNEEYKKRRAEALQKPGAIVGNVTLR